MTVADREPRKQANLRVTRTWWRASCAADTPPLSVTPVCSGAYRAESRCRGLVWAPVIPCGGSQNDPPRESAPAWSRSKSRHAGRVGVLVVVFYDLRHVRDRPLLKCAQRAL
jgi:hypothetical protein